MNIQGLILAAFGVFLMLCAKQASSAYIRMVGLFFPKKVRQSSQVRASATGLDKVNSGIVFILELCSSSRACICLCRMDCEVKGMHQANSN